MELPVEIRDRSEYKRQMNALLRIDPRRTVILTVDMQNDYLDLEHGSAPLAEADARRVLGSTRRLLDFCRKQEIPVIHTYVRRRPAEVERGLGLTAYVEASQQARLSQNAQAQARRGPDRVDGMSTAEVPAELVAPGDIHVTTKRAMDAFHATDLENLLARAFRPETVVITGINTDTCVYATTFAAGHRGYGPVVISDCVASMRGADHHWMALELMSRSIAWVLSVDEFEAKVRAAAPADQGDTAC